MKATHAEKNAEIQGIIGNLSVYQSELISEHLLSSHNEAITATKTLFFLICRLQFRTKNFIKKLFRLFINIVLLRRLSISPYELWI